MRCLRPGMPFVDLTGLLQEAEFGLFRATLDSPQRIRGVLMQSGDDSIRPQPMDAAQIEAITSNWTAACKESGLTTVDRNLLWGRQFLNPYAFEGAPPGLSTPQSAPE